VRYPSPRWTAPVLLCIFLSFCILGTSASATVRNVQSYGATGNGSTDDTTAINSCIGSDFSSGDTHD